MNLHIRGGSAGPILLGALTRRINQSSLGLDVREAATGRRPVFGANHRGGQSLAINVSTYGNGPLQTVSDLKAYALWSRTILGWSPFDFRLETTTFEAVAPFMSFAAREEVRGEFEVRRIPAFLGGSTGQRLSYHPSDHVDSFDSFAPNTIVQPSGAPPPAPQPALPPSSPPSASSVSLSFVLPGASSSVQLLPASLSMPATFLPRPGAVDDAAEDAASPVSPNDSRFTVLPSYICLSFNPVTGKFSEAIDALVELSV
ncbi:hypothetical protein M885DRAFT_580296 [Pelagophyceae sp. CCMP2097]|nr:hypothetical protein M885DRAFT_580296 [Pelagophyceae sp. CCMP2097]